MVLEGRPGKRELVKICDTGEAIALLKNCGQLLFPVVEPEKVDNGQEKRRITSVAQKGEAG